VFAEDVVPGRGLVRMRGGKRRRYHSVSAFGSSMGTAMRSSFGAAILSCGVEGGKLLSYVQVQNMVALREQTEQTRRSLGGVLEGSIPSGKSWN